MVAEAMAGKEPRQRRPLYATTRVTFLEAEQWARVYRRLDDLSSTKPDGPFHCRKRTDVVAATQLKMGQEQP